MKAVTPIGLPAIKREMDRIFERWFGGIELPDVGFETEWAPALDLSETKDAIVVKAEVPGLEPKQIEVTLEGQVLTIKGEKKEEKEEKDEHYYRKERSYGAFARSIRLPASVEGGKVEATFKSGVLTVSLPKAPAAKGTAIPVKAAA